MSTYEGMQLTLPYPDTWKVTEESDGDRDSVMIESPDSAFFSVVRYAGSVQPDAIMEEAIVAMESEYEEVEREDLAFDVGDDDSFGCELRFYVLDLLIVSRMLSFRIAEHSYLVELQAEDRDFEKLRPVFHAMLSTALKSLDQEIDLSDLPQ